MTTDQSGSPRSTREQKLEAGSFSATPRNSDASSSAVQRMRFATAAKFAKVKPSICSRMVLKVLADADLHRRFFREASRERPSRLDQGGYRFNVRFQFVYKIHPRLRWLIRFCAGPADHQVSVFGVDAQRHASALAGFEDRVCGMAGRRQGLPAVGAGAPVDSSATSCPA